MILTGSFLFFFACKLVCSNYTIIFHTRNYFSSCTAETIISIWKQMITNVVAIKNHCVILRSLASNLTLMEDCYNESDIFRRRETHG